MDYELYKASVLRTEGIPPNFGVDNATLINVLRIGAATGDLLDAFKKVAIYRKPLDKAVIGQHIITLHALLGTLVTVLDAETPATGLTNPDIRVTHGALGMFTEAGELLEAVIKSMETGELDKVNVGEELGDSDWYKTLLHDAIGIPESLTRSKNIDKLTKRYPEKFTTEAALNRDLATERKTLEA